ncbi:hypothetical protein L1987_73507 [Smallanthus sonchifolius]|uniref:Uncharacterized protein n=1 Tax=Smallanthus sonchifolius TaxID=185202 RepID=A0ACB9A1D8_9ASTR|nr:hypothetical protein L1987_73507 [Smallanthus sonchifolius]
MGFCLCCASHFAVPVYEIKDYLDWTEGKGIWIKSQKGSPSQVGATLRALLQASFCMDLATNTWLALQPVGNTISYGPEAAIIISGLGFSGWTDSSPPKARWDRAKNVDILGFEFATSAFEIPLGWNIQVSTWLRHCIKPTRDADIIRERLLHWNYYSCRIDRSCQSPVTPRQLVLGLPQLLPLPNLNPRLIGTKSTKTPTDLPSMDMEATATAIGVSLPVLRFLLCFVATIPVGFFHRFVPAGPTGKHLYAALTGAVLSYLSFGISSNLHFLVPMLVSYVSMVVYRRRCGLITFVLAMGYLIGCHVYYMSGDAWKEGGIDATGALMVLTLKVISCAINYNDGLLKEEDLHESQKKNRLLKLPSLIEYMGFCLCCASHFAGPVYEIKDYLDWTEEKGIWMKSEKGSPSPFGATLRALLQAGFCMGLYLYLVPHYPLSKFTDPIYKEWGFWKRLSYQYMAGFTARWKYYFIWSISEASIIISGLGFSGWTDSSPPKARWDRAKNVDILGLEFARSAVEIPLVWNIQVSTWLRHYVYDRLVRKGKKAGFFQLLATQTVSAVWHGLYPGYIIFFVQSALMIAGSRAIYRWQQSVPLNLGLLKKIFMLVNFAYTVLILSYSCVGFMVLSLHETLTSYGSVYYIGTIIPVVLILLGNLIKTKPSRSKARKEQ